MKFFPVISVLIAATILHAADPIEFKVGEFTFQRPEGWQWIVPSTPMRKAQLNVSGPDGASAEVTFFHFGAGQGGGVQANVDRWFGQFQNVKTNQREETLGKTRVIFVEAAGTFLSGMPGSPTTPKENYVLRGAILESSEGDVFIKMTGSSATVLVAETAFLTMVKAAAR